MAIAKRAFHGSELGMGHEDWYYLARDSDDGRVFVYHEWSHRNGQTYDGGNEDIEIEVFLSRQGMARDRLLELLGTLVQMEAHV